MLYTIFVLIVGIHLGQNYDEIPRIDYIFKNSMRFLKKQEETKTGYFDWIYKQN